ncbi:MAG: hypothetical protein ABIH41_01050 [Nanoarchaeota archaeon]
MAKSIETGVDKLVELVNKHKRISVERAAKELGVSTVIVQEWADFLEEEEIVGTEYSLSKVYLTERKATKKDIEKKSKEYGSKRDAFVRKVETAMSTLDTETASFEDFRKQFAKLKGDMGGEMDEIQKKLEEIRHFEKLKQNMDSDIARQREEFTRILQNASEQIKSEQDKYEHIIEEMHAEKVQLKKDEEFLHQLEEQEGKISERVAALSKALQLIDQKANEQKDIVQKTERRLEGLDKLSEKIEAEIVEKKNDIISPLIEMSEQHKKKIIKVQDEILEKIRERKGDIETFSKEGRQVAERFADFFDKKSEVDKLFGEVENDKEGIKQGMDDLLERARAFNLAATSAEFKRQAAEMGKSYDELVHRKEKMHTNLHKLTALIKGK